ncbi:MAG: outer membrane lipoprotein carrier protein LolA [Bacteroidales bacterium]|jgi:outer membrane lipoprotein-sorting protein|nr:outer membrane lipoprotein carrier protein LolA [Bacteroidales bacterium]
MKHILIFLLATVTFEAPPDTSLSPATPAQQRLMLEKITQASQSMQSLCCRFEQVKTLSLLDDKMRSQGMMFYRSDNSLRWEYTAPYVYTFVLHNNRVLMQTDRSRNVIDVKSSRLFQEIVRIMLSGVNGSGLADDKNFSARFFYSQKRWDVILTPLQKEMKQLFSAITLRFNANDYSVEQVEMAEKNGDTTVITLTDKKFNVEIADEKFRID